MNRFSRFLKRLFAGAMAALLLALPLGMPLVAHEGASRAPVQLGAVAQPEEASRVHVVLLVQGPQTEFGVACRKDVRAFQAMLEQGFGAKRDRLVFHDFTGAHPETGLAWNAKQVTDYLDALRLGQNESVVLFHSGHGAITDASRPEQSQILQIEGGNLNRGRLMDQLRRMNPRGTVVLTDCCSSIFTGGGLGGRSFGPGNAATFANEGTVQALFLRVKGVVSLTAAEVGRVAQIGYVGENPANAGSAFTVALLRLFCDSGRTYSSWTEFYPALRTETQQASSIPGLTPHQPHAFLIDETR